MSQRIPLAITLIASCLLGSTRIFAQQPTTEEALENAPPIIRVEEDWQLLIANPDDGSDLPQIVTVFGPSDARFGTHTVFELNHGTLPNFREGGMQLQVWFGDYLVGFRSRHAPYELATSGEVIRYTTVTALNTNNDVLSMSVINGTSQTWGNFGDTESLRIGLYTYRDDLNPYDPENSLRNSRVTFGANRVNHFRRNEIRVFTADGLYHTDSEIRYVHRLAVDVASDPGGQLVATNESTVVDALEMEPGVTERDTWQSNGVIQVAARSYGNNSSTDNLILPTPIRRLADAQ